MKRINCDTHFDDRLDFLADLINQNQLTVWHKLSREALKLYPVQSKELARKLLSFEHFEMAAMLGLQKQNLI